jgi:N-acylneuraminate cytidylyltransferase
MKIAIITARGGSKRIPRKNVRPFCGRPMIAWAIRAAQASKLFEHIIVTTEDVEIASIAEQYGASVPFIRPLELADDFTHAHVAARHALEWAQEHIGIVSHFCHIYPTAPFLSPEVLEEGFRKISTTSARHVFTGVKLNYPLYQALVQDNNGQLKAVFPPPLAQMRSQDMPEVFFDAGQMYWFEVAHFLQNELEIGPASAIVEIPPSDAIDIDTEQDWNTAEQIAEQKGLVWS